MSIFDYLKISLVIIISKFSFGSQWQQVADFSGAGRHRATGISIGNKGYIGMGHINGTGTETYYSDWWEYDPSSNAWTQRANYIGNNGMGDLDVVGIEINGIGYFSGGLLDPFKFYAYDPNTNSWSQETDMPSVGLSGQPVSYSDYGLFFEPSYDSVYVYNTQNSTWSAPQILQVPTNGNWYPAFDINEKLYFFNFLPGFVSELWVLDPVLETWQYLNNSFPDTAWFYSSCQYFNRGLLINGDGLNENQVFSYDPTTNNWIQLENFPGANRYLEVSFDINGIPFFGTGTSGINYNDFWRLNAITNIEENNYHDVHIYPNPGSNYVVFNFKIKTNSEIKIYTQSGLLVRSEKSTESMFILNRGNLVDGQYYYEIVSNNSGFTGTFILN